MAESTTNTLVADLEQRVAALEVGQSFDATKEAVQKVEYEFLVKLREIRAALQSEGGSGNGSGSAAVYSKEMEELRLENELLKKRNAKLEYRVQHVVANMEKMYSYRES